MSVTRVYGEGITSRAPTLAEADIDLTVTPRDVLLSGPVDSQTTVDDVVFDVHTPADVDREADIVAAATGTMQTGETTLSITNLTPEIATLDVATGRLTRVADGTARVVVGTRLIKRMATATILREAGQTVQVFNTWAAGSLARAAADAVDGAIAVGDVAQLKPMYSNLAARTRNPLCWAAQLADLSGIDAEKPNAHLIGQQYGLQAHHSQDGSDTFVAMDGEVVTVAVVDRRRIGSTDMSLVKYAAPLPAKFVPLLFPPEDLESYFGHLHLGVPALGTDQQKHALVADLVRLSTSAVFNVPTDARRLLFSESIIPGDSGGVAALLIPGSWGDYSHRLMSLTGWTSPGNAGTGPDYNDHVTALLAAIVAMGGSAGDVAWANLSGHPKYGA